MEIRCINAENYKLTVDKIYQAEPDGRDFYKLLNDNNIGVRYHKRLFEDDATTTPDRPQPAPARPVAPPPPPPRTERDLVDSITIRNDAVAFQDFDRQWKTIINNFSSNDSQISCGVKQISGINSQIEGIDNHFDLDEDDFITIRKALFRKCLEQYVQNTLLRRQAYGILSTNTSGTDNGHDADEDMLAVLNEFSQVHTVDRENPNSNRNIKVWILEGVV